MNGVRQMPSEPEQISDHGVYREEALGLAWRFEAGHLSLPLPRGRRESSARLLAYGFVSCTAEGIVSRLAAE